MVIQKPPGIKSGDLNQKKIKASINIDTGTLNILCRYIISDPRLVKISHISNLNRLVKSFNYKSYENDPDKLQRIKFISRGIEARLKFKLSSIDLILNHIYSGLDFEPNFISIQDPGLNYDEIQWANNMISEAIKYSFIDPHIDKYLDLCTRIKMSDFAHRGELIKEFEVLLGQTNNAFRNANFDDNVIDMELSLEEDNFNNVISTVYDIVTSPSRRILCGMQGLNMMTGGGFEASRVYLILGVTGIGKSVTLLNLAYQMKRHNRNYETKDPTKRPCIVYLTMENTVVETVTRLFDLVTNSQYGMSSYTLEEVIRKLRVEGQLVLNDNDRVDLIIKYKPNRSVDTSYLYELYDNLHDKGYEVICLLQDHLMRIKSVDGYTEPRFELGNIVNEFKSFAAIKDLVVITNFHLNREAMKEIENYGKRATRKDVTQKLGKSNVSESVQILNNSDCSIVINKDMDDNGVEYMGFNLIKMRDKPLNKVFYFAQPFMYSDIRFVEDIGGEPMYKLSVHGAEETPNIPGLKVSSTNVLGHLDDFEFDKNSDEYNLFTSDPRPNIIIDEDTEEEIKLVSPPVVKPFEFIQNRKFEGLSELAQTLQSRQQPVVREIVKPFEFIA